MYTAWLVSVHVFSIWWEQAHAGQINELENIRAAMVDNDIRSVGHYRSIDLQRMLTLLGRFLAEP